MDENNNEVIESSIISSINQTMKIKNGSNFYKTTEFPFMKILDANYSQIKNELLSIIELNTKDFFELWIEKDLYEESNPEGWFVAPLLIDSKFIVKNCIKAKFLYELIKFIPEIISCSFSLLKPGTRICPHKGYDEYSEEVLRYHMGIIIPKGDLGISVEEDIKIWKEGESFIFDDFKTHSAWNFSNSDRYVLICDFSNKIRERKDDSIYYDESGNFSDNNFNKSINHYLNK